MPKTQAPLCDCRHIGRDVWFGSIRGGFGMPKACPVWGVISEAPIVRFCVADNDQQDLGRSRGRAASRIQEFSETATGIGISRSFTIELPIRPFSAWAETA